MITTRYDLMLSGLTDAYSVVLAMYHPTIRPRRPKVLTFSKPGGTSLVDTQNRPLTSIRQGLAWDAAETHDAKAPSGLFGRAVGRVKAVVDGPPKSDLDNNTAFFSDNGDGTLSAVRLSNGSNQFPFADEFGNGPVSASKDATTGAAVGLDEWVDLDLARLAEWDVTCFATVVSTYDKGSFATSRNVTCSFSQQPTQEDPNPAPLGRILPAIDQADKNATLAGFGWLQDGVWRYKQLRIMGRVTRAKTVQESNDNVLTFAAQHVGNQLLLARRAV